MTAAMENNTIAHVIALSSLMTQPECAASVATLTWVLTLGAHLPALLDVAALVAFAASATRGALRVRTALRANGA